uniref:urocanate hydratase n=1 Tax=Globodera pallida TaxID=36090 RepID=A0A183CHA4_GLOPA
MEQFQLDSLLFEGPFDGSELPSFPAELFNDPKVTHAPVRPVPLTEKEKRIAIRNVLRYVPVGFHQTLAPEFADELIRFGHIYAFRLMPNFMLKASPLDKIHARSRQAAAIILMLLNNLDPEVAQFPQELVTYGGNGQVFSNWVQFRLTLRLLAQMSDEQTLAMYSGHPLGLFPSHKDAPRVVITNGMMIPNYSSKPLYDKFFALGVTIYGQMTAGSYSYIGPQGIVHGTTITLKSAIRKYLGRGASPAGKVFVSAGLGGMSGAQAKAAVIAGCVGVIAEVSESALRKRHDQGWLDTFSVDLEQIIGWIRESRDAKRAISIGYLGNVVQLWERLAEEFDLIVELGSDQTSCHNPFGGGYYPVGLSVDEANQMMSKDKPTFVQMVQQSLLRQIAAIQKLCARGMHFWDYGNAFLVECHRAGAQILAENAHDDKTFIFPSYMQDIMGDIFSLGFGPFRWVCTSGSHLDLQKTDRIAAEVIQRLMEDQNLSDWRREQYEDNLLWIQNADKQKLVVGSEARILYSDGLGRVELARAFNTAIRDQKLEGPVVISRDHHDVSGTDSPFRETSDINDGSAYTADMAIQNVIGDSFRGATWVSIHNGGGVGWGDVMNGGFGMLLDGSAAADRRLELMLAWDVANGVARRCWAGNARALETVKRMEGMDSALKVVVPEKVDEQLLDGLKFG